MTITTQAGLSAALDMGIKQRFFLNKASITATSAQQASYWKAGTLPAAATANPTTAAVCTNDTLGAIPFTNPPSGQSTNVARWTAMSSTVQSVELHDRLVHMGGLDGTLTTAQTVGIDLGALGGTSNLTARMGKSDYSMVQWYLEWYTATGTTTTATIAYMDQSNVAQTTTVTIPASAPAGRLVQIVPTISGSFIRAITSVTLAATTGTAGNFGVTATAERTSTILPIANLVWDFNTALPVAPGIPDSSCLFFISNTTTTSTGTLVGTITLAQG